MLSDHRVHTTFPASDLARARAFYEGTLGFTPTDVNPGAVRYYAADGTSFVVFASSGQASGTHTQGGFSVEDLAAEVGDLKRRGVVFETYDFPGFDPSTSIAQTPAGQAAWFKDTEGNLLGLVQFRS
jgi:catechol 2,3-dioxygenase-like lactoylglutathione lyase family enzyme